MINLSELFKEAHAAAKACFESVYYEGRSYSSLFASQLTRLWAQAKRTRDIQARNKALTERQRVYLSISALESKDRWSRADYEAHINLSTQLRQAA